MTTALREVGGAEIAAGILAAAGALHVDLTVDDIAARLVAVRDTSSFWRGGGWPAGHARAGFVRWRQPDPALLAAGLLRNLGTAFVRTFPPAPPSSATFLRLEVGNLEESTGLSGATAQGVRVVPHLRIGATGTQRAWRSPLRRVGVAGESGADVVVVAAGDGRALASVLAPVAVVVGAPSASAVDLLNRAVALGYGGIALADDRRADLRQRLGATLARGLPLDVALAMSVAGDVILVVEQAMLHSEPPDASAPSWSPPSAAVSSAPSQATPYGAPPPAPSRSRRLRWRRRPKDDAADEVASVRDRGLTLDSDGAGPEPARSEAAPDRRLQAEVRDDTGSERRDGFAAGRRHELRIRIAAEGSDTVISADRAFTSPVVGKAVDLTIVVRTRGSTERPVRRTLRLPADGDTEWTNPIPIDVPAHAAEI
ncbi:MAG: hypothetical protein H0X22_08150, partial [Acidimicrobiia bacterium]|nr:hypothetical protein [Acidimicrobiia bacterium]